MTMLARARTTTHAFAVLLGLCAGCSSVARLGVGPTVDTEGNAGFDVTVTVGLGSEGVVATSRLGGGMGGEPSTGSLMGGVGLEGGYVTDYYPILVQGGLSYAARVLYQQPRRRFHGLGFSLGSAWAFHLDRPGKQLGVGMFRFPTIAGALGLLPRAEVLWSQGRAIGYFSFPITIQYVFI